MKRINETNTNKIAITIVPTKITFSAPLFVWYPDEKPSPPPNEEPRPASDCCRSTPAIRSKDNII